MAAQFPAKEADLKKEVDLKEVSDKLIQSLSFDVPTTMQHPFGREKFLEFLRSGDIDHSGHSGKLLIYIDNLTRKFGSAKVTGRKPLQDGDEELIHEFKFLTSLLIDENFPGPLAGDGEGCSSYIATLDTILTSPIPLAAYNKEMSEWNKAHDSMLGLSRALEPVKKDGNEEEELERLGFWGEVQRQVFGLLNYDKFPRFIELMQQQQKTGDLSEEYRSHKAQGNSFDSFDVEKLRALRVALRNYVTVIDNEENGTGLKPIKKNYQSYNMINNFLHNKILTSAKHKIGVPDSQINTLTWADLCEYLDLFKKALEQDTFITATQPTVDALLSVIREVTLDILKKEVLKSPTDKSHHLVAHRRNLSFTHLHSRNSSTSVASTGSRASDKPGSRSPSPSSRTVSSSKKADSKPSSRSSSPSSRTSSSPRALAVETQTSSRTPSPPQEPAKDLTHSPARSPVASPHNSIPFLPPLGLPPIHPTSVATASQSHLGSSALTYSFANMGLSDASGSPVRIHYGNWEPATKACKDSKSKTGTPSRSESPSK